MMHTTNFSIFSLASYSVCSDTECSRTLMSTPCKASPFTSVWHTKLKCGCRGENDPVKCIWRSLALCGDGSHVDYYVATSSS